MKIKVIILALAIITILFGCNKSSSPDGRAQLRDNKLAQKIELLNKKQIVILDSLKVLDQKIEKLKMQIKINE